MFEWLWKANRWYDDLTRRNMGIERFIIFLVLVAVVFAIFTRVLLPLFGIPTMFSDLFGALGLFFLLVPRIIWIENKTLGKKYPSKYSRKK